MRVRRGPVIRLLGLRVALRARSPGRRIRLTGRIRPGLRVIRLIGRVRSILVRLLGIRIPRLVRLARPVRRLGPGFGRLGLGSTAHPGALSDRVVEVASRDHDVADQAEQEDENRGPHVQAQPEHAVGLIDAQDLDPHSPGGVDHEIGPHESASHRPVAARQVAPEPDEEGGARRVPQRLVQEGRVEQGARGVPERQVGPVDLQAPGQGGGPAEQLLVEVVAEAPQRLRDQDRRGGGVVEGPQPQAAAAQQPDAGDDPEGDAAPDAQSPAPDLRDEGRVPARPEVGVRRGDHVVEPRADDADRHRDQGDVQGRVTRPAQRPVAAVGPPHRHEDAGEDAQGVGAQRKGPDVPYALGGARDGSGEHSENLSMG